MTQDPEINEHALTDISRSQEAVKRRVAKSSLSYDLIYSTVVAAMVGGQAAPFPVNVLASGGGAMLLIAMWRRWTETTGVRINGLSHPRARWIAIIWGVCAMGLMLAALYAGHRGEPYWGVIIAVIAWIGAFAFSRLWLAIYRDTTGARS